MQELDRVAAILRPTEKMLAWINQHAGQDEKLTLEDIRTDCTIVLLPAFANEEEAEHYLLHIYADIFSNELASWNDDDTIWPQDRSIEIFLEWFDIEFHSLVYDTAEEFKEFEATESHSTLLQ